MIKFLFFMVLGIVHLPLAIAYVILYWVYKLFTSKN